MPTKFIARFSVTMRFIGRYRYSREMDPIHFRCNAANVCEEVACDESCKEWNLKTYKVRKDKFKEFFRPSTHLEHFYVTDEIFISHP